jgi:hypothetical protein
LRKFVSIFLLTITFLGLLGYSFILGVMKEVHKESMMEKIKQGVKEVDLSKIPANSEGIYWLEDGKEFYYNNHIYDLVKEKTINGQKTLLCIEDDKEETILDTKNGVSKQNSAPEKNSKHAAGKQMPDIISFSIEEKRIIPVICNIVPAASFSEELLSGCNNITVPPPEV